MYKLLTLLLVLGLATILSAQSMHDDWTSDDTLATVSVSGTAIVDSSMMDTMYYIDEDGDGVADYHLSFGPYWYQPDSSSVVRPNNGDMVAILGGLENDSYMNTNTIIVYEVNGDFWRDPMIPSWNNLGGHHGDNCDGFAYGLDSNRTMVDTSLDGTVYIDTTYFMDGFYLDTDNDQVPDYSLNFGPPWYVPASGAERPNDGDAISIKGKIMSDNIFPMVIVYELNGMEWRDSSSIGDHFGGEWFQKNITIGKKIYSPFDMHDWVQINPGWNTWGGMGGMGGMMMYDSLFCQILELFPQNIPFSDNENFFAGYEIGIFSPNGNNGMWDDSSCGGMMNFGSNIDYQFHYSDIQVQGYGIDENSIKVKYWNRQNNSWVLVNNSTIDKTNNTIKFPMSSASNFVILTADQVTHIGENSNSIVSDFSLKQNYPNPFNPSTKIEFSLNSRANIQLNIYNALGQKIATLVNSNLEAGIHSVTLNAPNLASGIYFYELKSGSFFQIKKMMLLK